MHHGWVAGLAGDEDKLAGLACCVSSDGGAGRDGCHEREAEESGTVRFSLEC